MIKLDKNNPISDDLVLNKIYHVRGAKVMLDKDLAALYEVQTRDLNKAVSRNIQRFPADDFMFQLTDSEFKNLMFHFGTSSWGGNRKLPYAFTEQGVAMLSGLLKSDRAIAVNIMVMRVFTQTRRMLADNSEIRLEIEKIKSRLDHQDKNLEAVFRCLDELLEKRDERNPPRVRIGFKPDLLV